MFIPGVGSTRTVMEPVLFTHITGFGRNGRPMDKNGVNLKRL